mgnify:CR=1 FL=1
MSMTMTQKILAAHAGKQSVQAGELLSCQLDLVLVNDITGAPAIDEFQKLGLQNVFDRRKIALVPDHFTPNKDIKSAGLAQKMRTFAREMGIENYFELGEGGIEHVILPEKGLVAPGELIIGADSHTCTYGALGAFATGVGSTDAGMAFATGQVWLKVPDAIRVVLKNSPAPWVSGKDIVLHLIGKIGVDGALYQSLEFYGDGLQYLNMADRLTIANMAVEAGAKNGLFPVDAITEAYLKDRVSRPYHAVAPDADAFYSQTVEIDLSQLSPTVACPNLPANTKPVAEVAGTRIDQVVIGSCTNGRIEDLRIAAHLLKGKRVQPRIRCLVIPGSQAVYRMALREGLLEIFSEAGAVITMPTCGPCLGGHCGVLAAGEVALATTNRNFTGRMGDPRSQVYLASPAVAAASAIHGVITSPASL